MALHPLDEAHALQIQAGTIGRKAGHTFEDAIAQGINNLAFPLEVKSRGAGHVYSGNPALLCLRYIAAHRKICRITSAMALSTGALATSEDGKKWLSINGANVSRCKSDLVITMKSGKNSFTIGVSTKQCNNRTPTNAQLFFTTARGFVTLLRNHGLAVSDTAVHALRQFCGDEGFRPSDDARPSAKRVTDPRRYFWEETEPAGRGEWEYLFSRHQDDITRLLLQKAYIDDPFVPDYILHKTRRTASGDSTEVAIYSIEELVASSRKYQGFTTREYSVRKGTYKDPVGVTHLAPRFGVIQMQRGGQKQHPNQLQFNLEAGYFYKI